MRARTSFDTLAPGVKVRETADRDTPARSATSAAVTNEPRERSSLIAGAPTPILHTCALSVPGLHARAITAPGKYLLDVPIRSSMTLAAFARTLVQTPIKAKKQRSGPPAKEDFVEFALVVQRPLERLHAKPDAGKNSVP